MTGGRLKDYLSIRQDVSNDFGDGISNINLKLANFKI